MSKDNIMGDSLITLNKTGDSAITKEIIGDSLITKEIIGDSFIGIEDVVIPPVTPPVIEDGNTVGWYIADDLDTITKDGSDFVSSWRDFLGSGHDLLQVLGSNQPKWVLNNGILFDGIDNFMKTLTFTFGQPEQIYIVFRYITWTNNDRLFDGDTNDSVLAWQSQVSNSVKIYAGIISPPNTNLPLNTFGVLKILFNGANSSLQINNTPKIIGDYGLNNSGGFTLGSGAIGLHSSHIQVKEVLLRNIVDITQDEQDIYDYLKDKYAIV